MKFLWSHPPGSGGRSRERHRMFSPALHYLNSLQLGFVSALASLSHMRGPQVIPGHLLHSRGQHPRPTGSFRSMGKTSDGLYCGVPWTTVDFHRMLFLWKWSVSPERNPSLSSLAEHKVSYQDVGGEERTGVSLFSMQTSIWNFLIFILVCYLSLHGCSNPGLIWCNFIRIWTVSCLGPEVCGLFFFCTRSACSPIFHSAPQPHLLR